MQGKRWSITYYFDEFKDAGVKLAVFTACLFILSACSSISTENSDPPEDFYDEDLHGKARGADLDMMSYLLGMYDPRANQQMVLVDRQYAVKDLYLQREAYEAFRRMYAAAKHDGVKLSILSGLRTYDYQRYIWQRKWEQFSSSLSSRLDVANKILQYSAMPAASRHHWGTDVDLNSLENSWFDSGEGKRVYAWLMRNAARFGYCQVYTLPESSQPPRTGYGEERWHWSYIPVSSKLLDMYVQRVSDSDIGGFDGDDLIEQLHIRDQFVVGISPSCKAAE